jgi:succinate-semialdehyde dehydrogenase/glutarate-semialdehyde dehydrogenase
MIATINPASGETLRKFDSLTAEQVDEKLQRAAETFVFYSRMVIREREPMLRTAEILESEKHELGRLMTIEMGKPIKSAVQEAEKCAGACRYYAQNARYHLADEVIETNASRSYVRFEPLGPVLAVMPWNFPFWQVFRFAAPALMAGNVGLLKHASNVPQCALAIEDIFRRGGFPEGSFQTLLIGSDQVERILSFLALSERLKFELRHSWLSSGRHRLKAIKKTVLELAAAIPFVVMPSANAAERWQPVLVRARSITDNRASRPALIWLPRFGRLNDPL